MVEDLKEIILDEEPEELFEELETIGTGNYGVVIKARNRKTNEIVAIKQILLTDKAELDLICREIIIMQKSNHPNIVRYYGAYRSLGKLWIVMEYCEGGSVDQIFKLLRHPIPESLIAYICRNILLGLQYLHENRRLHRDIKGGNILLTADGEVKLADFGVSTELSHTMSRRNTFTGTVLWMAPEAIIETDYNDKADMWSLGITVIEMAENRPPHLGVHVARVIFMIPKADPPTLQHKDQWSPQMNMFIKRLLTKDKIARPGAAAMLNDPFVHPDSIGTKDDMKALIERVLEKKKSLQSTRLGRGDFSRSNSSATFVERTSSSDGEENDNINENGTVEDKQNRKRRSSMKAINKQSGIALGGVTPREVTPAPAEANDAAVDIPSFFTNGTIPSLPLLSTQDISFDELGGIFNSERGDGGMGGSSLEEDSMSVEEVFSMLEIQSGLGKTAREEGIKGPAVVTKVTKTLQQLLHHNKELANQRGLTKEEMLKARQMQYKYGTALKSIYRI